MHRTTPLALIASLALLAPVADAQSRKKTNPSDPDIVLPENPYISYDKPREWIVQETVYLLLPQNIYIGRDNEIKTGDLEPFPEAIEFVFPMMNGSGSCWTDPDSKPVGSVSINDALIELDHTVGYAEGSHAPYTLWPLTFNQETRVIRFEHKATVITVDTEFNETEALKLTWPDQWPSEAGRFLTPIIDPVGETTIESEDDSTPDETVITDLITEWTGGHDPKQLPPVHLAKFLTGKVIEHIRSNDRSLKTATGSELNRSLATGRRRQLSVARSGFYAGFEVRSADESARTKRGSRHDMSMLLTAVFRAAGLPARTVIGLDDDESGTDRVQSWTEFALYDPDLNLTVWVPVDIDRLRRRGARSANYKQKWKFFGTHDELHHIAPVSFYFHPPAAYQSFEVPALYGIRSQEELPRFAEQVISFQTTRKAVRGGAKKKN